MTAEQGEPAEDQFSAILAAHDEAVAAGQSPDELAQSDKDSELHTRLERALACVKMLEAKWPRAVRPRELDSLPSQSALAGESSVDSGTTPTVALESSQAESDDSVPDVPPQIGRFQIERELGHGGFGIVFLAFDPRLRRAVALKVPRPGALVTPDLRSRFVREACAAAGLDHPNILPVYEAGDVGAVCYLTSAYCRGPTLARWLRDREQPVPVRVAASLAMRIADAIQHAHSRGVLHRDLTPSNVLLEPRADSELGVTESSHHPASDASLLFEPRITDFGLAKFINEQADVTRTGVVLGTVSYVAPEQASGKRLEIGPAVDIYGIGAILYELLTGRPPFQGETPLEIVQQVQSDDPLGPRRLRPKLPRDLETICMKCLQKEPAKRYASALELSEDLQRFLRDEPIRARPVGRGERLWIWCRRKPLPAALTASLTSVIIGSIIALSLLWRHADEQRHLAELNATKFDEERQRAERNLESARTAVREHFVQISGIKLNDPSDPSELRKKQLESALRYFQDFLAQRHDDPALRLEVVDTHYRVAMINSEIGAKDAAFVAYEEARALQEKLVEENPDNADYRYALAVIVNDEGAWYQERGDGRNAVQRFERARAICQELVERDQDTPQFYEQLARAWHNIGNAHMARQAMGEATHDFDEARKCYELILQRDSDNPVYLGGLALTCHNLGHVYRITGKKELARQCYDGAREIQEKLFDRFPAFAPAQMYLATTYNSLGVIYAYHFHETDAGISYFEKSRELQERLVQTHPAVTEYQVELARTLTNLGSSQRKADDRPGATRSLEQARMWLQRLVREHPSLTQYQLELAATYGGLAGLSKDAHDLAAAAKHYGDAMELLTNLVATDPSRLDFRNQLGGNLHNLGLVLEQLDRRDEALERVEQAIEQQRVAFGRAPHVIQYRSFMGLHYSFKARLLRDFGRLAESVATLQEFQKVWPDRPEELLYAAREIAYCAKIVGKGAEELSEADRAIRQEFADLAMESLRRAVAAGLKDADALAKASELESLRSREDYQKLAAELGSKPN